MAENLLTHQKCMKSKPTAKVQRLRDGNGVFLTVEPSGSKYFVLRYKPMRPDGTRGDTYLGLGAFPETTLDAARTKAAELRTVIKAGGDPRAHIKVEQMRAAKADAATFRVVADEYMARNKPRWSTHHYERNEGLLRRFLYPTLGDLPITSIDRPTMLAPLRKAYDAGRMESARRSRAVAAQVFQHAIDIHQCESNPARELDRSSVLAKPEVKHHKALKLAEVGPFLRALRQRESDGKVNPVIAAALRLSLIVNLRDSTLRKALWKEIDLESGVWTALGTRMKSGREHRVPLPAQAVAILTELAKLTKRGPDSFVFPSKAAEAGTIAENTLTVAIRACGYDATLHGTSRSTIADVLTEAGFPTDAIERQADRVMQGARAAYVRTDYFQQRKVAMAWLADWLDAQERETEAPPAPADNVVQFRLPAVA